MLCQSYPGLWETPPLPLPLPPLDPPPILSLSLPCSTSYSPSLPPSLAQPTSPSPSLAPTPIPYSKPLLPLSSILSYKPSPLLQPPSPLPSKLLLLTPVLRQSYPGLWVAPPLAPPPPPPHHPRHQIWVARADYGSTCSDSVNLQQQR